MNFNIDKNDKMNNFNFLMLFLTEFVQEQLPLTLGINMLLTVFCGIIQNKILLTFARTDKNLSWMFN